MDVQQQGHQSRNFAITKSKLQHMKHDPSVSIDDFISKMLVSTDNLTGRSPAQLKFPKQYSVMETGHISFTPSPSSPNQVPDSASDDAWDNFKSSLGSSSFMQARITEEDKVPTFDVDFDGFTSCKSVNQPSNPTPIVTPVFDSSSQKSGLSLGVIAPLNIPNSSDPNQTLDSPGSFDEFSDFVGSGPPLSPSTTEKFPIASHETKNATHISSSTAPALSQEQLFSKSTLQETDPEDGFEDFQACAYESPFMVEQIKQLPTEEWLKCLSECRSMLSESVSILSSLVNDSDVDAFLATPRGNEFILELIEIYGIIQRIRLAASLNDLLDSQLQSVFNQIDRVWGDLARFVKNQDHKLCKTSNPLQSTLKRRLAQSVEAANMMNTLSVEPNCGVCVTPVPAPSTAEAEPGTAVISLAGRVYHAPCANLWVNRIELSLPALRVR
ncbi:unnamed protein product [Hydatigera taeniaeformis]|uniref:Synergin gamma-like n=1 Tax=Hydatigena taeniaeformis TaxID=6205 RepID=A0A0R3WI06_HYDTA|nr:unnamed protein product [Hydatigera taeniaeformis]